MRAQGSSLWLFWLVALLILGAGLGLRDPWPSDEPRFALVARQMVESGNWWFPHRGSELYSDKPPMLMWWQAALYSVLGNWRVAFLLPSLLAALVTLGCVYDLGRRLWNRQVGLHDTVWCSGDVGDESWLRLLNGDIRFGVPSDGSVQINPLILF